MARPTFLTAAVIAAGSLIAPAPAEAQHHAAGGRSRLVQFIRRPALESAAQDSAVITWTDTTGGGTDQHYGIVRYGSDPRHLDRTARSPNRTRKTAATMTYRVWIDGLAPSTIYYYTVDDAQADGIAMGLNSPVSKFTTRPRP